MTIKRKLVVLLSVLFLVIVASIVLSGYYVNKLVENSREIVKDNYKSLLYTTHMNESLDSILMNLEKEVDYKKSYASLNGIFALQNNNATEPGEATLNDDLFHFIVALDDNRQKDSLSSAKKDVFKAKNVLTLIFDLNAKSVEKRNENTGTAADEAILYSTVFFIVAMLVTLVYIFQIPKYLIKPIQEITKRIQAISNRNYDVSVDENRFDEFKEMAIAFNSMAQRLRNFEKSNTAKLVMERNRLNAIVDQFDAPILGFSETRDILFVNKIMLDMLQLKKDQIIDKNIESVAKTNDLLQLLVGENKTINAPQLLTIILNQKERLFSKRMIITETDLPDRMVPSRDSFILLNDVTDFIQKDSRKTQFMATLSHELKTPVAAIELSTDLLSSDRVGNLNTEQKKYVRKIIEQASRIRRMVNEVLDISKIEAGNIDFDLEYIKVETLIEQAVETVIVFLENKKIKIVKDIEHPLPKIKVDAHKLLWALNNFLTNAIRYTPEAGKIHISASKKRFENGSEKIRIEVTNFGKGISSGNQKRIFEKYVRLNDSEKGGTGLGLAISKEFVEAMGGTIGVESIEGAYARFWIEFLNDGKSLIKKKTFPIDANKDK